MSDHQHEEWQLHTRPDGGVSCSACGVKITPAKPDDAARAEAKRLYPPLPAGAEDLTYPRAALREFARDAYLKGRADERARIAARRDEVAEALHADDCADDDCEGADMTDYDRQADIVLAALGVSDR